jgi:hypothetical protein
MADDTTSTTDIGQAPDRTSDFAIGAVVTAIVETIDVAGKLFSAAKAIATSQDAAGVISALAYHSGIGRAVQERLAPLTANFAGDHSNILTNLIGDVANVHLEDLAQQTLDGHDTQADATELASLRRAATAVASSEEEYKATVSTSHGLLGHIRHAAESEIAKMTNGMLNLYLEGLRARKDDVLTEPQSVAADMIVKGMEFGLSAHLAAIGLEALYPTKHLGINQLVGYMADFAGFSKATGPIVDAQLKNALHGPAEHQAAKFFRTHLPSSRDVLEQAYQRHVTATDYRRALELEGYPDDWINVLVADMYVDPRAREVITLLEGADIDPAWLTGKFREIGWDDVDVAKAVEASMHRMRQPATDRYARSIGSSYVKGWRGLDDVRDAAKNVTQDDGYLEVWQLALREEKANKNAEDLAAAVLAQYQNDLVTADVADEMLESLGYPEPERNKRLAITALARNQVLVKSDVAAIETTMRQVRAQSLTALKGALRQRGLTLSEFVTYGQMLGYDPTWLGAVADVELAKAPPKTVNALSTAGLQALERELEADAIPATDDSGKVLAEFTQLQRAGLANLRAQVRAGLMAREEFLTLGAMLGFAELTLQQLADVDLLYVTPDPAALERADPEDLTKAGQVALAHLTADLVARKVVAGNTAVSLLATAGVPVSLATKILNAAEISGAAANASVTWPHQNLTADTLIASAVSRALGSRIGQAFADPKLTSDIVTAFSGNATPAQRGRAVLDGLVSLFGRRQSRSRTQKTVTPSEPPKPLETPPTLLDPAQSAEETLARVRRQRLQLEVQLDRCRANAEARGLEVVDLPGEPFQPAGETELMHQVRWRDNYQAALDRCVAVTGGYSGMPPAPPPSNITTLPYYADALNLFRNVGRREPTALEIQLIVEAWPTMSWDAIMALIRQMTGQTAPVVPSGPQVPQEILDAPQYADALQMWRRITGREPTPAEITRIVQGWPTMSWDALEVLVRQLAGIPSP